MQSFFNGDFTFYDFYHADSSQIPSYISNIDFDTLITSYDAIEIKFDSLYAILFRVVELFVPRRRAINGKRARPTTYLAGIRKLQHNKGGEFTENVLYNLHTIPYLVIFMCSQVASFIEFSVLKYRNREPDSQTAKAFRRQSLNHQRLSIAPGGHGRRTNPPPCQNLSRSKPPWSKPSRSKPPTRGENLPY